MAGRRAGGAGWVVLAACAVPARRACTQRPLLRATAHLDAGVEATAAAAVVPRWDRARLALVVEVQAATAAAAESRHARQLATVRARLLEAGVPAARVTLTPPSVATRIVHDAATGTDYLRYAVERGVDALVDTAALGRLIDRVVRGGVAQLVEVRPTASGDAAARRAAVARAVHAACADAHAAARAVGSQLGPLVTVQVVPGWAAPTRVTHDATHFGPGVQGLGPTLRRVRVVPALPAARVPGDDVVVTARWRLVPPPRGRRHAASPCG